MNGLPSAQFLTLLALRDFLDSHSDMIGHRLRTKKQYQTFIESLLDMLCSDTAKRYMFTGCGGILVDPIVNGDGKVIDLVEDRRWDVSRSCSGSP